MLEFRKFSEFPRGTLYDILQEAIHRISSYAGLKKIIVCTNSNLVAPQNYESAGFKLYDKKKNDSESAYTGDYLYYEIIL